MGNANASSGDQFQDLAFPPDYPASVAFVLRNLKNQKDETDAVVNALRARVTVLEGIAETSSGRIAAVETAVTDRVKKSSIQSLDPSTIKLSPASIKEFLVTMVNAMKAGFALALLVPTLAFGGGKDIYGNDLTRTNKLGYVDGDLTTVGDLADFGAASPSVITSVVEGLVHPWARAKEPPSETDPTVPYWAKQLDPPAETDPTVKEWAKADNPPAETDPTVPTWAKADNPPAETDPTVPAWAKEETPPQTMTTNTVDALANSAVVTNALTVATTNRVALLESSKADKSALAAHVTNTNNPHAVTAEQIDAVPFVKDVNGAKTAVTIGNRKDGQYGGSVGYGSLANGFNVNASGVFSHAEGQDTSSPGFCSHSEGYQTTATGDFSHAEGSGTGSNGKFSHAEGDNTFAFADYSHVAGRLAQTLEGHDHAYVWNGDGSRSEPYASHDRGTFNINPVGGINGFWIGEQTLDQVITAAISVKADYATTLAGYGITDAVPLVEDASMEKTAVTIGRRKEGERVGEYSFANGGNVTASGNLSHAEGGSTTASGTCSHAEGVTTTASGDNSHSEGNGTIASGMNSHAEGEGTTAAGPGSHAEGIASETREEDKYAFAWNGDDTRISTGIPYPSHGPGTFNINPVGGLNGFYIGNETLAEILTNKADKADISSTNPTFSNAVLAVGLNIDTNSVAVLNDIAATFGGFPLGAGETATTVGGLLLALAAAVAWLKKNKVQTLKLNDNSVETSADGGVAKLDDFFTESNSLLTGTIDARLPYSLYAVPSTGLLKDRAINTTSLASVTVPDNFTDLLVRASVASSLAVTMPEATTKYGDTFPGAAGEYLITITKTGAAEAYVRTIKLEVANA